MKKWNLTAAVGYLSAVGYVLRRLVYAGAVDEKNLIVTGHPFVIVLWVLTAAALVLAVLGARKAEGSDSFAENFAADNGAFLAHVLLGVGIALSVLQSLVPMPGLLGLLWKLLGVASLVCLLAAGFRRMQGKVPFFALYAVPCLFFAVHVVANYQIWCSNPQFTDYAFALLGSVCLSLNCYQMAAFSAGAGKKKMLTFTGLLGAFLCAAELTGSAYPAMYFGGILFCLSNSMDKK